MIDDPAIEQRENGRVGFQIIIQRSARFADERINHPFVRGVAAGQHHPAQPHRFPDHQAAHTFLRKREPQSFQRRHGLLVSGLIAVDNHATAAESPTHV